MFARFARSRSRLAGGALLVGALGLAGCGPLDPGEPPSPMPTPSVSASPVPTPSPSVTPSVSPSPSASPTVSPSPSASPSASPSPSVPADATVQVRADVEEDHVYDPADITVAVGATVVWEFVDGGVTGDTPVPHDVVFNDNVRSPIMTTGTYSRTFAAAGTFDYICSLHPTMLGSVTVQ